MSSWPEAVPFGDVWARAVAGTPDAPVLTFEGPDGSVTDWTYASFDARNNQCAKYSSSVTSTPAPVASTAPATLVATLVA